MDVVEAVKKYVTSMVSGVAGMKVLLLDEETAKIISLVYTQGGIVGREVYLVEPLAMTRDKNALLKAVCYLRPTAANVEALRRELQDPKYPEYHIFFSNIVRKSDLEEIAEADTHELVKQVQEYYADFYPINSDFFSLRIPSVIPLMEQALKWDSALFDRMVSGLLSVLLARKKRPAVRFQGNSHVCRQLAEEIVHKMEGEAKLFDFRQTGQSLLLILDRREDPVTPLLNQWHYQAMVHELLGIDCNKVDLSDAKVRKDLKEVVLSANDDEFFRANMYVNFGDLGVNVKEIVDKWAARASLLPPGQIGSPRKEEQLFRRVAVLTSAVFRCFLNAVNGYGHEHERTRDIQTVNDMKRFIEGYGEFSALSAAVSKHVAVMSEMSALVDRRALMEVSELEQTLAVRQDHAAAHRELERLLDHPKVTDHDKMRLALLYILRYETRTEDVSNLVAGLLTRGLDPDQVGLIAALTRFAGSSVRAGDVFSNRSVFAMGQSTVTHWLKGVENVFTQHEPLLAETLDALSKLKLRESMFPYAGPQGGSKERPTDVTVFIVGGVSYEEARVVARLNAREGPVRYVLGGTDTINSKQFMENLQPLVERRDVSTTPGRQFGGGAGPARGRRM